MRVSIVIPTLNAQCQIQALLERLLAQDEQAAKSSDADGGDGHSSTSSEVVRPGGERASSGWDLELLVVDSGSQDGTMDIVRDFERRYPERVRFLQVPQRDFDHGGTRDCALRQTEGDYVLFLTQDALPMDRCFVENLLAGFSQPDIAAVYGRHVAYPDAPVYERLTREFNYPDRGRVWRERDIGRYGVKAYYFSNVCSAYRRDAYLAVGGFDAPVEANEDMLMAAKLLHAGYTLAYEPSAVVLHSHDHTLRQEYERYEMIGSVMWRYRERLRGADANSEGSRMVHFVLGNLLRRGCIGAMCVFLAHACARYLGSRAGERKARRGNGDEDG